MKTLTSKDAVMTVTIRIAGEREDFFFYSYENYTELIKEINKIQLKTLEN